MTDTLETTEAGEAGDETPEVEAHETEVEAPEVPETPEPLGEKEAKQLRAESAERRVQNTALQEKVDAQAARLLDATIKSATEGVLADPSDLLIFVEKDELLDDDGFPDAEKVKAAAEALVEKKSHLAPRRAIDIGQGPRGVPAPETHTFADWIRSNAL